VAVPPGAVIFARVAGASWPASFLSGVVAAIAVYLASRERTTEEKAADLGNLHGADLSDADLQEADLSGGRTDFLARGDARVLIVPPNDRYEQSLRLAQARAAGARRGLWSTC